MGTRFENKYGYKKYWGPRHKKYIDSDKLDDAYTDGFLDALKDVNERHAKRIKSKKWKY